MKEALKAELEKRMRLLESEREREIGRKLTRPERRKLRRTTERDMAA